MLKGLLVKIYRACTILNPGTCENNARRPACAEKLTKRNIHEFLFKCGKQLRTKTLVMAAAATICQRYYAQRSLMYRHRYVSTSDIR